MSQVLVVGAGLRRSRLIDQGLEGASVRVIRKRWSTFLHSRRSSTPMLVIYDLTGEDAPKTDVLLRLPSTMPETGVLYLAGTDAAGLEGLSNALQQPNVDFILDTDDPRELRLRANRLLARGREHRDAPQDARNATAPNPHSALRHTVPHLHASSGRLDAREVSALYGVSLAALARALGRSEQAVHKTPTAPGIQPALRVYERIAAILLHLTGSETGLRTWMQASNPELEDETPMTLLLNGEGEVVAELLEDVLRGEPA
jgi:hypothetical protein